MRTMSVSRDELHAGAICEHSVCRNMWHGPSPSSDLLPQLMRELHSHTGCELRQDADGMHACMHNLSSFSSHLQFDLAHAPRPGSPLPQRLVGLHVHTKLSRAVPSRQSNACSWHMPMLWNSSIIAIGGLHAHTELSYGPDAQQHMRLAHGLVLCLRDEREEGERGQGGPHAQTACEPRMCVHVATASCNLSGRPCAIAGLHVDTCIYIVRSAIMCLHHNR